MGSSTAVSVANLSKQYRIRHRSDVATTAAEAMMGRLRHPLRGQTIERFDALDDVSFDVQWGEILGIVGRNGAGKSTLLKILTRITAPTRGRVELDGRIGSLLEIGTGFHQELTGRENIFLNGSLIGMRRGEIRRHFDAIVEFAGVERFLDTQVKRYSTGMYVRLAFAVAAHLESEVLAVDEVLAVGDADFQEKCLRKIREVAKSGRTVLLVSHQIQTVTSLCTSAIYLERGRLRYQGPVEGALEEYKASFTRLPTEVAEATARRGSGEVRFTHATCSKDTYDTDEERVVRFRLGDSTGLAGRFYVSCHINDVDGVVVAHCDSRLDSFWLDPGEPAEAELRIKSPWLKPGSYSVDLYACGQGRLIDEWDGAATFQVAPIYPYRGTATSEGFAAGIVLTDFSYECL